MPSIEVGLPVSCGRPWHSQICLLQRSVAAGRLEAFFSTMVICVLLALSGNFPEAL